MADELTPPSRLNNVIPARGTAPALRAPQWRAFGSLHAPIRAVSCYNFRIYSGSPRPCIHRTADKSPSCEATRAQTRRAKGEERCGQEESRSYKNEVLTPVAREEACTE